jgi:hypothetical protein
LLSIGSNKSSKLGTCSNDIDCSLTGKHDLYSSLKAVNLSGCLDLQEFSKILAGGQATQRTDDNEQDNSQSVACRPSSKSSSNKDNDHSVECEAVLTILDLVHADPLSDSRDSDSIFSLSATWEVVFSDMISLNNV